MSLKKPPRYGISDQEIIERHFALLERLLRGEEAADRDRYRQEVLQKAPEEQEKGGKALYRLVLYESHFNPSGQRLLSLGLRSARPLPRYTLHVGDVVRLSAPHIPPFECPTGIVYDRTNHLLTVAFGGQLPRWVGRAEVYHLIAAENQTTYQRMYEALKEVAAARHSRLARLRDISLGLRKPAFKDPVLPERLSFSNNHLNELQRLAVAKALEAEDVFLLHGPPGTGKTAVLAEMVAQARQREETILVSAPSNAACDLLVEILTARGIPVTRLGHPARINEVTRKHTLAYKLACHPFARMIDENEQRLNQLFKQKDRRQERRVFSPEERGRMREEIRTLKEDNRQLKSQIFQEVWNQSDVVVATHTVAGDPLLKGRQFDWVILDEATQATEPMSWIPLARARKIVLAGDHHQLPPTVLCPRRGQEGLQFTLFERLHKTLGDECKIRLSVQYRMNEKIMKFSSQQFYGGALVADPSVKDHLLSDLEGVKTNEATRQPLVFLDTAGLGYEEKVEEGTESRYNENEARLAISELERLLEAGVPADSIALISPYSAQVKLMATMLFGEESPPERYRGLEVDSIDAFQGREKEAVIVSLVRSNLKGALGFLTDTRRMNVAMTRARRKLIVIGDSATIAALPFYQHFVSYVESENGYRSAWEYEGGGSGLAI